MTTGYRPLHLPPDNPNRRSRLQEFFSGGRGIEQGKSLVAQLSERDAIPPEVWGTDRDRQRLAAAIGRIVAKVIPWPNAHFIPEDPFGLVVFALPDGKDDLELSAILMATERLLGLDLDDGTALGLLDMTFGEVVDLLLERSRNDRSLPIVGPGAPENRPCPSLAIFLDLRNGAKSSSPELSREMVRPSTRLRDVLSHSGVTALDHYVRQRFDKDGFLGPEVRGTALRALCVGLIAASLCVFWLVASSVFYGFNFPDSGGWTWLQTMRDILSTGMFLVFFSFALIFVGLLWSLCRRFVQIAIRWERSRTLTFADLVRHIQTVRNQRL